VTNKIFTLASEIRYLCSKWQTLSIYERFEQTVVGSPARSVQIQTKRSELTYFTWFNLG
jgi:hypothetical protein